jgi:glycosidase
MAYLPDMRREFVTVEWARGSNIYEVNIRQYTSEGSFAAFSKHLPRLRTMGVEILWLMPVTPISIEKRQGTLGSYYACSSYTEINPEFGTMDDFKKLVNEAHTLGFKIIIDWVANHTGLDHHWTKEHPDWYLKDEHGNFTEKNGWEDVIDLNYDVSDMRKAMIEAMQFWVRECDIDGFRCDMAHLVRLDFWAEARKQCEKIKSLFWLAECEVVNYHDVFDATYTWWWMHVTEDYTKGKEPLETVRNVLHAYSQYPAHAMKLFFTSNHDENSWNGTEYEKYGVAAKAWAVFTQTWERSLPLIYSGQESPNRRRMKFFDKDLINWNQPLQVESFYETLLSLRRSSKAITEGETFILPSEFNNRLIGFLRKKAEATVLVVLNVSPDDRIKIKVRHEWLKGRFRNIFSGLEFTFDGEECFELQKGEYLVYQKIAISI